MLSIMLNRATHTDPMCLHFIPMETNGTTAQR